MEKIEQHLSKLQFYKEWHEDHRLVYLSWGVLAMFISVTMNIVQFSVGLEAYRGELTSVVRVVHHAALPSTTTAQTLALTQST